MLAAMALMSLPSHLFIGWIADRVYKPLLMAVCMIIGAVAVGFLALGDDLWSLWLFTMLITFVEAIFPVSWATVGDFFGRKHFATIRGMLSFFYMWGSFAGPVFAGAVYDRTESYVAVLWTLFAILSVATLLNILLIKPWRQRMDALGGQALASAH
jgi:MFS family permease